MPLDPTEKRLTNHHPLTPTQYIKLFEASLGVFMSGLDPVTLHEAMASLQGEPPEVLDAILPHEERKARGIDFDPLTGNPL